MNVMCADIVVTCLRGNIVKQIDFTHFGDNRHDISGTSDYHSILLELVQFIMFNILLIHNLHDLAVL